MERAPENSFADDIRELPTYQQIIWRLEKEELFQGYDPSDPDASPNADPTIPADDGEPVNLPELIDEINNIEMDEEEGDPIEGLREIRRIKPLLQRVMELRSTRKVLNSQYAQEWQTRLTPTGEEFSVHAIDRAKVKEMRPPEDDVPIVIAPGYTVGPRATRRNAIGLAELGHSVMTYAVPTNSKNFDPDKKFGEDVPVYSKVHATALLRAMEEGEKEIFERPTKFDVIGYSFGAISTLIAADAAPEKFRNIVLINPAGLTHTTDPELLLRLKQFIPADVVDSVNSKVRYVRRLASTVVNSSKHGKQVLEQIGEKSPTFLDRIPTPGKISKALSELGEMDLTLNKDKAMYADFSPEMKEIGAKGGLSEALHIADAISWADMLPIIERLRWLGIQITILPGEGDPLFDVDDIERSGKIARTDTFAIAGGHAQLGFRPGAISEISVDSIHRMNEKRAAEENNI
ncbi:MAG: hypothetical protein JWM46_533 [Candidatus Kaiserbacteria bacterium]|nr:hypothetical protein [Candidatus Kaiserbacteria bacterium]